MTKSFAGFIAGVAVGAAAMASTSTLAGRTAEAAKVEQAAGSAGSSSKVVFENARVRVKDVTFASGVTPMHTHDLPHVGVVIQGGTLVFKDPAGKVETMKLEPGGAGYREANVSHEPMNPGKTPVRVIEVELK